MNNPIPQPKWKKVEYSRNQIINAGELIKRDCVSKSERRQALQIIDNWRSAHAFPLHVIYMHLRRMAKGHADITVVERLKRLDSILNKLKREPHMNLWTMQDLGGCRFIVPSVEDVYMHSEKYENSKKRHVLKRTRDYIKEPRVSGYRSLHKIYEYHSDRNDDYNRNMLIEIQFRTHLQHLWATAVETMGLFTQKAIKSGQGSDDVKRFFVLVSSLFAIRENQPVVPNTIADVDELILEIESLNSKHNFLEFLDGITVAVDYNDREEKRKTGYALLVLNYDTRHLKIYSFSTSDFDKANDLYNSLEAKKINTKTDIVLVGADSFSLLKSAYPNYFSDIGEFVNIIKSYLK